VLALAVQALFAVLGRRWRPGDNAGFRSPEP
jgi:hypothetical protein